MDCWGILQANLCQMMHFQTSLSLLHFCWKDIGYNNFYRIMIMYVCIMHRRTWSCLKFGWVQTKRGQAKIPLFSLVLFSTHALWPCCKKRPLLHLSNITSERGKHNRFKSYWRQRSFHEPCLMQLQKNPIKFEKCFHCWTNGENNSHSLCMIQ